MKLFICILLALPLAAPLRAEEPSAFEPIPDPLIQAERFLVPENHLTPGDLFVIAREVEIAGEVRDDLFVLAGAASSFNLSSTNAGRVAIPGLVRGSLWAAGLLFNLSGEVERHLRLAAQSVRLDGRVGGNLWLAGQTVNLGANAIIGGHARIAADYFILRGVVDGHLVVSAREVVLDGTVNGSASVTADKITILPAARVRGDLQARSPNPVIPAVGAVIEGTFSTPAGRTVNRFALSLISLSGAILAGLFLSLFCPRLLSRSTLAMETRPWKSLFIGMAALIFTPVLALFALASLIGFPLGVTLTALYAFGVYAGRFVAALAIARLITGLRRQIPIPAAHARLMILGLLLFQIAAWLPGSLGSAVWFWFTCSGLGGMILSTRADPPLTATPMAEPPANPPPLPDPHRP